MESQPIGKSRHEKMFPFLVPLAGFAFAVLTILTVGSEVVTFGDAPDYLTAAEAIGQGKGYPRASSLPFFRPPLYPFFIACVWQVAPGSILAIKLTQAGLFAATCWLLYRLGFLAVGDRLAALLGGLLYSINPFALRQVAEIQSETLHTVLIALAVFSLARGLVKAGWRGAWFVLAGIIFGVASLCRPTALPVGLGLAVALLPPLWKQVGLWRATALAGMVPLGLAIGIAPFTWFNWQATGEFIPITDAGGYHLWLGNHPDTLRIYQQHFANKQEFDHYGNDHLQHALPGAKMAEWEATTGYRELSLRQRERLWQNEAFRNIRQHPGTTAALVGEKAFAYWRPWLNPSTYSLTVVWVSGIAVTGLYLLAGVGAWLLRGLGTGRQVLWILAWLFLFSTLVHALVYSMVRFRLPYVDPYLCVLAGVVGQKFFRALGARRHPSQVCPLPGQS